jgi:hypothetical protein
VDASELTQAEAQRRDLIAAIAAAEDARLAWRHVFALCAALTPMTLCAIGITGAVWPVAARQLSTTPAHLRGFLPLFVAMYLLAALFAAWAWARFDLTGAAHRLPRVLVFGAVGVFALLAIPWLQGGGAGGYAAGIPGDIGEAVTRTSVEQSAPGRPLLQRPSAVPTTLASALVSPDEAAAIVGAPVGLAEVPRRFLIRGGSFCRYRTLDRQTALTIVVKPRAGDLPQQLLRKGEPIAGLGERAVASDRAVVVEAHGWRVMMSIYRRKHRAIERPPLIDGAKRAIARLPDTIVGRSRSGNSST